jgi:hypothetical protein
MLASAAESGGAGSPTTSTTWASTVANLAAGATAGCAVEAALYPIDTIKTRLQAMIGGGGLQALLSSGGGKALYAGVWGNLVGVAPSSAIFMAFYEPVKQAVHQAVSEDKQYLGPVVAGAPRRRGRGGGGSERLPRLPRPGQERRRWLRPCADGAPAPAARRRGGRRRRVHHAGAHRGDQAAAADGRVHGRHQHHPRHHRARGLPRPVRTPPALLPARGRCRPRRALPPPAAPAAGAARPQAVRPQG